MLQAMEQDRVYIKLGNDNNTYLLLVDESVSPHTKVSTQCFNSSYFIQSTLNKSRSWSYREMDRVKVSLIVLEHGGFGGGATHKSCTCVSHC